MRLPRVLTAALLAALAFNAAAQVIVEDEIITKDVNLFDIQVEIPYNLTAAIGLSALLPGAGHYYIDKPKSALVYMSIDAASFFGAVTFNALAGRQEKEARSYAAAVAGITRAPSGEAYWRHVGAFMDAAAYNEAVELSRGDAEFMYLDPDSWWRWGDESQRGEYNGLRQQARNLRVASSFFIGALVANRLASMVDLRVFQKKSLSRGVRFEPALSPDLGGAALVVNF
ncbi:MAG: hypothetical protein LBC70_05315 [Chitinispirillales bacterium]|nr:hypothetical protein [Chitinispirillales bacterium]